MLNLAQRWLYNTIITDTWPSCFFRYPITVAIVKDVSHTGNTEGVTFHRAFDEV